MAERWLSVDEIGPHVGLGRETVYRWIDQKGLPAHRIGKFWNLKVTEVDEWARAGAGAADDDSKQEGGEAEAP